MSTKPSRKVLVTGATGQIGSELVMELRKKFENKNVVAVGHSRKPSNSLLESGPFEFADVSDRKSIEELVKKHDIGIIYHMAALLSATGEKNPQLAWNVNMDSLCHILEIAKEQKLSRVFWPSSIAAFGPSAPRDKTPQNTVLIPSTMYGVTKVAGELLCNYYFLKYGLDVRSVRYPGIISSETPPGGGTTDYAVEIFYEAIKNKHYACFVREDTVLPMMYMPDCLKATIDVMEAEPSRIKVRTSYNISGISFSAGELAAEITRYVREFKCEYKPDFRQKIADSWPMSLDDTVAKKEWGWKPRYNLASMTMDMLEKLSERHAEGKL
jgi:nucleoside-diphosphate-sugar epimerase